MKVYLSRRYRLSASHRLHTESYSIERNREVYGKCNHPFGHGHNYVVEVMVSGPVDPATGMVCDVSQLDDLVKREVVERFDHGNMNLDPVFSDVVPTTENFCIEVYKVISAGLTRVKLEKVRVEETSKNFFEYAGTPVIERLR